MAAARTVHACRGCGQQLARWAGRCPGCGAWGTIEQVASGAATAAVVEPLGSTEPLGSAEPADERVLTGLEGVDRVLGGAIVPAAVILLAGEPGIGKSTLLLQVAEALGQPGERACSPPAKNRAGRSPLAPDGSRSTRRASPSSRVELPR